MSALQYTRYALFYTPPPGAFATAGAQWLGWDSASGRTYLPTRDITERPRKYGFHGTIKPPFRLSAGTSLSDLRSAVQSLCRPLTPVTMDGLEIAKLGSFLALVPTGDTSNLTTLAAHVVRSLDPFRAPLTDDEYTKRAKRNLSHSQKDNLDRWGYPYVMGDFRFHMTLTGPLSNRQVEPQMAAVLDHFASTLPRPFTISSLTLMGETADGLFREIERYALAGDPA